MKKYYFSIFLISILRLYCAEISDFDISKDRTFAISGVFGPLVRNLKDLEQATHMDDPKLKQNSDFVIDKLRGYVLEGEAKYRINKWITLLLSGTYTNADTGSGTLDVYNVRNDRRVNTVEFINFKPRITEKAFMLGNEATLFEKKLNENQQLEVNLFLGYYREKVELLAQWEEDVSRLNGTWQGFVGGLKFGFNVTKKLNLGITDFIRPDKFNATVTRDSFLGTEPGTQELLYFGNSIIFNINYEIKKSWLVGIFFEWERLQNVGKAKLTLVENDRDELTNPKLCLLRENIYYLTFGISKEF